MRVDQVRTTQEIIDPVSDVLTPDLASSPPAHSEFDAADFRRSLEGILRRQAENEAKIASEKLFYRFLDAPFAIEQHCLPGELPELPPALRKRLVALGLSREQRKVFDCLVAHADEDCRISGTLSYGELAGETEFPIFFVRETVDLFRRNGLLITW